MGPINIGAKPKEIIKGLRGTMNGLKDKISSRFKKSEEVEEDEPEE